MTDAMLSRRAAMAGLAAAGLLPAAAARAQQYPTRPVRWIVGYPAGGGTDVLARLLGAAMSPTLGQQMVIENRPGAATNLAAGETARSEPDGHTVFTAGIETLVYNPALYKKLPFDPDKDFRPVGLTARFHLLLTVKKDSALTSARDLVARAKASPGTLNYGSPGLGSPHHLAMERLLKETGATLTHVPYRGMAPVINDMLAGVMEVGFVDFAAGRSVLSDGTLRPIAVASATRLAALPNVPTIIEALGLTGFEAYAWQGVVVPARTPDPVVARLAEVMAAALKQDQVRQRMVEIGLDPLTGGPAEFNALMKADRGVWWPIIQSLGITLE
ncbi:Bug family tripartite tricarboxylate transporter substrate binding protein [Phreatobacter sp. AB_2022a]|uniref:Bug family tripartite tricarboxylate transporter substrate binding protein n=1 Tax=Phreatobacter sp. AB_2022a TaxID=3003134 RepID=UPI002286E63E|nr:tripartite tricarboxylate transporter substrate binding protein [Phreatobacter sp. AB_2022a]MCZ0736229.1 tripartite tricarboxylate transporter substrate binding protein [Phreatobacter sp. AB_2022a]